MKKILIVSLAFLCVGIANAQKVGINTTSPDSTLTVAGSTRISGNTLIGGNLKLPAGAGVGKVLQSDAGGNASWSTATGMPAGTAAGQILYWNGSAWVYITPGSGSQSLVLCNGVPTWGGCAMTLTTNFVSAILQNTAVSGGNITDSGSYQIVSRGVCYGTTLNPTIAGPKTIDGSGAGSFTSNISGLGPSIQYYVRSYATNSAGGTSYGDLRTFTTYPSFGSTYAGGFLFYLLQPGDYGYSPLITHGLVVTTVNVTGIAWCPANNCGTTAATDSAVGFGFNNTVKIYNSYGGNCAGSNAYNMNANGYTDWFLPSKDELFKISLYRLTIGGFNGNYWSSTETTGGNAWSQNFGTGQGSGGQSPMWKEVQQNFRAIRRF